MDQLERTNQLLQSMVALQTEALERQAKFMRLYRTVLIVALLALIVLFAAGSMALFGMNADRYLVSSQMEDFDAEYGGMMSDTDASDSIALGEYRLVRNGTQSLVLGTIVNEGEREIRHIQLEAEFLDAQGELVYECSDYITQPLDPGESENYQMSCGCGDNPLPAHESFAVRVVSAMAY